MGVLRVGLAAPADQELLGERGALVDQALRDDGQVQYALSNLPPETSRLKAARVWKQRWRVEQGHQQMKEELGLDHFEGRGFLGWHHHVTLVSVAHAFCTLQRLTRSPKETASA